MDRKRMVVRSTTQPDHRMVIARITLIAMLALAALLLARPMTAHAGSAPWLVAAADTEITRYGHRAVLDHQFADSMAAFAAGDLTAAVRGWQALADQGHAKAQFNLGVAYAQGQGMATDMYKAMQWWRRAALNGHTEAQYNLGVIYGQGIGVPANKVHAQMWWYLAAIDGDAAAQFNLGVMSVEGDGLRHNVEDAVWWWSRAAAQGFPEAVKALDILEKEGVIARR
jgi:TPR repeat protein